MLPLLWIASLIYTIVPSVTYFDHRHHSTATCPGTIPNQSNASIAALILARGGSKGIPLKNLAQIDGKPLLVRALQTLAEFGRFGSIWVSTDDDRIAREVELAFPADQARVLVHMRPPEQAQDHTSSLESTQEFLRRHPEVTNLALIQCTSPFLKVKYLVDAFERFGTAVECVFSVMRSFKLRWKEAPGGRIAPLNFNVSRRPRRQDWSGEWVETGMFYFARRALLLGEGVFQNENCAMVEVDVRDALEIDSWYDLELAKILVQQNNQ
ncbi:N-acylneuraminate cytidylyltransferase A [Toxorhynchites rutilus septentrionalis]|uniref:N-acylneuraminate cytidylyltransferase A n=1 Tax=Toxorhynchites rutilus septentrionalis TaxID=329112 RepID=UPI00247A827C|nr:N-acylneuraminate cytidylyltransferase A [Toxorhynchites rutilus septentrionalis]